MIKSVQKFVRWQLITGQLDHWTAYHLAGGAFICKAALWLGASDLWAVLWVVIIGLLWEVFEYFYEGTAEVYGTKQKWLNNTLSDLIVEIGLAIWMVI
jgi:hypothetical protein